MPAKAKMQRTTVFLPAELRRRWEAVSRRIGKTQSVMYREAMDAYLEKFEAGRPVSELIGNFPDPDFDARDTEEYLAKHWAEDIENGRA